jgi:hypothetical protein
MATKKAATKKAATKKAAFNVVNEGKVVIELKCGTNIIIESGDVYYDADGYRNSEDSYFIDKRCLPTLRDLIKVGQSLPKTESLQDLHIEYVLPLDYSQISAYYGANGVAVTVDDTLDTDKPDMSYPDFIGVLDAIDKALGK